MQMTSLLLLHKVSLNMNTHEWSKFCICEIFFQIFESEARDEETEVCFVDIAYDEIPERHYKESEVSEQRGEGMKMRGNRKGKDENKETQIKRRDENSVIFSLAPPAQSVFTTSCLSDSSAWEKEHQSM